MIYCRSLCRYFMAFFFVFTLSTNASAYFMDGEGHYGMRGVTLVSPGFAQDRGTYQAIEQSFDLRGELRANERASFNLRLGIFEDPRRAYLGETPEPKECAKRTDENGNVTTSCAGRAQDPGDPGYTKLSPHIREAYGKYAFPYCLLNAGRRSRETGLGIFMSAGKKAFDSDASVYDGIGCDINLQKQQELAFSFGFDKLQERGDYLNSPQDKVYGDHIDPRYRKKARDTNFGATSGVDDMDQIYFGITLDDTRSGSTSGFSKQVAIYFSNAFSTDSKTDLKYFDLYSGFFIGGFAFKNELLFRVGRSASPSWVSLGGARDEMDAPGEIVKDPDTEYTKDKVANVSAKPATNNVQSFGFAGTLEWAFANSGSYMGPAEFNEGTARRHMMFLQYAYAPGDQDGYYQDYGDSTFCKNNSVCEDQRDTKVSALPFHRNFKPALLLFNAKPAEDDLRVDGVFNASRFVNATLLGLGYRYESIENGNFESKIVGAQLNEGMPDKVKEYFATLPDDHKHPRPIGYFGNSLGYELDLTYSYFLKREFEIYLGSAIALPGKAWQVYNGESPSLSYLLQTGMTVNF